MKLYSNYQSIFKKYYKNIDNSHNFIHIMRVVKWCHKIIEKNPSLSKRERTIIILAAFLHDAYDSKYVSLDEKKKKKRKIQKDLDKIGITRKDQAIIFKIIDNISFSKEQEKRKNGIIIELGNIQYLRDIVSDADKLESLGKKGIIRMIEYEKNVVGYKSGQLLDIINAQLKHIYELFYDRLSILIKDNYIKTPWARLKGEKLLQETKRIIDNHDDLIDLVLLYM